MLNWFRKALDSMVHTQPSWIYDLLPRTKFDYKKEVGQGYGSSVIMAPINWIGRTFPEAELVIDQAKGDETETITDHDLLRLIDRPNAFYTGVSLWKATIASRVLSGNAYWIKIRNSVGQVIELWYTPHWMIGPAWPTDGTAFISHYLYKPAGIAAGAGIKLDVEDVVHFREGIDPRNPRLGQSPIYPILREIFSDDEAANFGASMLRNMGVMGVIISPKTAGKSASGADALATKERLGQQFTGDKRGEFMVMTSPTEVTQFGFSPQQMDLSALRNISEERVTAQIGIPAAVVGFGTGLQQTKVGATMKELVKLAWTGCVIPMQRELGSEIERSLLPDFEPDPKRFSVRFDHVNVEALQESQNEKVDRLDKGIRGGWVEVAEGRQAIGLEVRPADHIFLRQLSTLEIPSGKSVTIEKVLETRKQLINGHDKADPLLPLNPPPRRRINQAQRRLVEAIEREHGTLSDVFEKELTRFFDGMGKDAARIAREVLSSFDETGKALAPGDLPAGDVSVETALIAEQLNLPMAQNRLREVGAKHYLRVGGQTFATVNTIMGLELNGSSRKDARTRALELMETFGLKGFERQYPFALSGGMRQRAAFMRTMLLDQEVILLDEPFGALDALTRVQMQEWLMELWDSMKKTIVLITHDVDEALLLSDRVYVLTARPARVKLVLAVGLGRPRSVQAVTTPEFVELKAQLLATLHEENSRQMMGRAGEPAR